LVDAEYRLKNVGNQDLAKLDVRLPGARFHSEGLVISWDSSVLPSSLSADRPRDTVLNFPQPWATGSAHVLHFSYQLPATSDGDDPAVISADAFCLPAEAWAPQLPPPLGVLGFGGVPPAKWDLLASVPQEFLVHASGEKRKRSGKEHAGEWLFRQSAADPAPFVVAGRYREFHPGSLHSQQVYIWTRVQRDPASLAKESESFAQALAAYDAFFGAHDKSRPALWIVDCPLDSGCRASRQSGYSKLLFGTEPEASSEMISQDTVVVGSGVVDQNLEIVALPAIAAGWLGYGRNPGFYQQELPVSALPAFAAAQAREAVGGPHIRDEIIRRALEQVPAGATRALNRDPQVFRAKSLLLFYALRDRVGADHFRDAMQHMLAARRSRGFELADMIAALEQESHQPIGPFVREWIKGAGVPEDFRARYALTSASKNTSTQEATP
jgi:hypothetical protein